MSFSTGIQPHTPVVLQGSRKVTRTQRVEWPFKVNRPGASTSAAIKLEAKEVIQTTVGHWAANSNT